MVLRPTDFKSGASTDFATQAWVQAYVMAGLIGRKNKAPRERGFRPLEREKGLEPSTPTLARSCSTN